MSMASGQTVARLTNEPNVTPMIDVLLVLLIIFMVVLPSMRKAIDVQLPDPNPTVQPANSKSDQIVLEVQPGGSTRSTASRSRSDRLADAAQGDLRPAPREDHVRQGRSRVKYADVIYAMDIARGAGVKVIGVPPKDTPEARSRRREVMSAIEAHESKSRVVVIRRANPFRARPPLTFHDTGERLRRRRRYRACRQPRRIRTEPLDRQPALARRRRAARDPPSGVAREPSRLAPLSVLLHVLVISLLVAPRRRRTRAS